MMAIIFQSKVRVIRKFGEQIEEVACSNSKVGKKNGKAPFQILLDTETPYNEP